MTQEKKKNTLANTPDNGLPKVKGESLMDVYWRRFKKHTLGKIGAVILLILYAIALFADFLSPYDMTWTDKYKSYHPPSSIYWFHKDQGKAKFRPFVYEKKLYNVAFKKYKIIPAYTLRAISCESIPGKAELRVIADQKSALSRKNKILDRILAYYDLDSTADISAIDHIIDSLEQSSSADPHHKIDIIVANKYRKDTRIHLILAKGNKNFLSLFFHGIPYTFLGIIQVNTHFFGSPTGGYFPLGADSFGRDVLSRLFHGSRVSLSVGLIGAFISFFIGLLVGGIAGYFGGITDNIIMRACEIVISFPALYLLFALRATFPPSLNSIQVYILIVIIMSFLGWAGLARIIRGLVLSLKNEEYVLCAQSMGLSHFKIITRHILPNTLSFVIIQATLTIPFFILGESGLSLLGLGITDPQASWGLMLAASRNIRVVVSFPWILIPGFFIFLAIIAWNFFGDGIRDAVDPRSTH